jgi:hypothetical protein
LIPATLPLPLGAIGLSAPVAFQYPLPAARLGREPFGYLRSRGVKKYHSLRPNSAFSEGSEQHRTEVKNDIQDLDLDEWIHDRIKDCLFSKNEKIFC